jgi:peptidoglycan/LPS O-acetylase OafA/YrhL
MRRFSFLDSMRGFAASWAVFFHLNEVGRFQPGPYQWLVKHGWLGVIVFFVISGFSVHLSLLRSSKGATFLERRLWRIYPPYLASLALVLVVIAAERAMTGANDLIALPHGLVGWVETLTLTTKPVGSTPTVNWVYWSLSYELAFYVLQSLALFAPRIRWAVLIGPTLLALIWKDSPIFFLNGWSLFALGAAVAEWRHRRDWRALALGAMCLADLVINRTPDCAMVGLATAGLIVAATSNWGDSLNREAVLRRVGTVSYSLYLVHVPIGCWLALKMDRWPRPLSANNFALHVTIDAGAFVVCLAAASAFWWMIEKPSIGCRTARD